MARLSSDSTVASWHLGELQSEGCGHVDDNFDIFGADLFDLSIDLSMLMLAYLFLFLSLSCHCA